MHSPSGYNFQEKAIVVFLISFCVVLGHFSRDLIGLWALQENIKN